jgi:hypothetical protein
LTHTLANAGQTGRSEACTASPQTIPSSPSRTLPSRGQRSPRATNALHSRKPARPGSCGRNGRRPSCSKRSCCRRPLRIRPQRSSPPT